MKRLVIVAIMAAFLLGTVGAAQAAKIEATGDWRMSANYVKNPQFDKDEKDDKFQAVHRLRTQFNFIANENLRGVFRLHTEDTWGNDGGNDGSFDGGGTDKNLGFDLAYIDFLVPNTDVNVRAGLQPIALPNTLGSHIIDDFVYGVTASTSFNDMVGLTLGWARLSDSEWEGNGTPTSDEVDAFLAIVPVTMDGMQFNPFVAYGRSGRNAFADFEPAGANDSLSGLGVDLANANHFWAGVNATIDMFDPIVVMADFNYGQRSKLAEIGGLNKIGETRGWIANLAVQYNMDFMTPMAFFLYESGESSSSNDPDSKGKRMPNLVQDVNFSSFGFNGSNFRGLGRNRLLQVNEDSILTSHGLWALGLKLQDISFVDKLSHEFLVAYYQGTNHKDLRDQDELIMTTKDKAWEANFNTKYQVYENLSAILELGYIYADFDDRNNQSVADDAAWKAAAGFVYNF